MFMLYEIQCGPIHWPELLCLNLKKNELTSLDGVTFVTESLCDILPPQFLPRLLALLLAVKIAVVIAGNWT